MNSIIKQYNAKLDEKKRITIRGTKYKFYHVNEFSDGTLVLKPRALIDPNEISKKSLNMMDGSMKNFKKGKVSKPIKLEKYLTSENSNEI